MRTVTSELLKVPGIGPVKRRRLLQEFGSVQGVRDAGEEAISKVPGFNTERARSCEIAARYLAGLTHHVVNGVNFGNCACFSAAIALNYFSYGKSRARRSGEHCRRARDSCPGRSCLTVNGRDRWQDFLDWEFLTADDELVIEARKPDGERVVYEIERPEGESLGVELEPPTVRRCANRCEFCFIEGLPQGLRKPLYVRDDDYRLSFAYGNFATLSNVKERDIARILEYRLSPLYISVHATPLGSAQGSAQQPARSEHRRAADAARRGRHPVPLPDGDRAGPQRRRRARGVARAISGTSATPCFRWRSCRSGSRSSRISTPASRWIATRAATLLAQVERWDERATAASAASVGVRLGRAVSARRASSCPTPSTTATSRRSRTASASVTSLRMRVADGPRELPRLDGQTIGVVTGVSMAPLMPRAARAASTKRPARRSS